jgi:hypothetical protein
MPGLNQPGDQPLPNRAGGTGKKHSHTSNVGAASSMASGTKSALINHLAEQNDIPRKAAPAVHASLEGLLLGSVHPRGVGEFSLPGLLKISQGSVIIGRVARAYSRWTTTVADSSLGFCEQGAGSGH